MSVDLKAQQIYGVIKGAVEGPYTLEHLADVCVRACVLLEDPGYSGFDGPVKKAVALGVVGLLLDDVLPGQDHTPYLLIAGTTIDTFIAISNKSIVIKQEVSKLCCKK